MHDTNFVSAAPYGVVCGNLDMPSPVNEQMYYQVGVNADPVILAISYHHVSALAVRTTNLV